jgi:hypothetical protein
MIEKLSLRNFRVLRDVDVDLRPFSLLVGPNASGKSSLLAALELLTRSMAARFPVPLGDQFLSRRPQGKLMLSCAGHYSGNKFSFPLDDEDEDLDSEHVRPVSSIPTIRPPALLHLDIKKLAAPSIPKVTLVLPDDGEGLSSVLAGLYLQHPKRFQNLLA